MTDTNICHADSASANELFKRLTMEERDRFFSALRDPASDIAQSLLASTELDQPLQAPWWELPDVPSNDQKATAVRYGHMPPLLEVPQGVIKWDPASPPLLYNICAILWVLGWFCCVEADLRMRQFSICVCHPPFFHVTSSFPWK